jgi:hypothetical protein
MRVLLLSLALLFTGCPAPTGSGSKRVALKLEVDTSEKGVDATQPVQLHLRFLSGDAGKHLMGALIEDGAKSETTWHVEPADAAEIDPSSAQLTIKKPGPLKIWATYKKGDQTLKSNVVEIPGKSDSTASTTTATATAPKK